MTKKKTTGVSTSVNKSTSKRARKATPGADGVRWAKCYLSSKEKKEIAATDHDEDSLWLWAIEMVDNWHKFSIGYNAKSDSYIASLTGQDPDHDNYKVCLSGHGGSAVMALAVLRYKVVYLCDQGIFPLETDKTPESKIK